MVNARKQYKSLSRQLQRKYDQSQTSKLLDARVKNVKLYWRMLNKSRSKRSKCPIDISELYNHFLRLSDPEDDFYTADADIIAEIAGIIDEDLNIMFEELNAPITSDEIVHAIKQLKCGKSGGDDLLLNEFFIHGQQILLPYIVSLFNYIFDVGVFPDAWCDGLLIPLHKKGSQYISENYRGITLLSVLGKLFTRTLNIRIDTCGGAVV